MKAERHVLCLNTGSSSLKLALYDLRDLDHVLMVGAVERIGLEHASLRIEIAGRPSLEKKFALPSHEAAVLESLAVLKQASLPSPTACVHRVVHGGPRLSEPVLITEDIKRQLRDLVALAPLHIPDELSVIEAVAHAYPDVPQIACFDTAFHQRMPSVAKRLPLPRHFWEQGVRRYGFHGLSYEYVVSKLHRELSGRSIVAHLGNGCSMVALRDGVPQDTTMGLTPSGGLMMGIPFVSEQRERSIESLDGGKGTHVFDRNLERGTEKSRSPIST